MPSILFESRPLDSVYEFVLSCNKQFWQTAVGIQLIESQMDKLVMVWKIPPLQMPYIKINKNTLADTGRRIWKPSAQDRSWYRRRYEL